MLGNPLPPLSPLQSLAGWCSPQPGHRCVLDDPCGISQPELFIFVTPRFLTCLTQFCLNFPKLPEAALLELSFTTATCCPAEQRVPGKS